MVKNLLVFWLNSVVQTFKDSFMYYLIKQSTDDNREEICKFIFRELPDDVTKDILLGVFLSNQGAELTLQEVN